jgi:hypothetical protein
LGGSDPDAPIGKRVGLSAKSDASVGGAEVSALVRKHRALGGIIAMIAVVAVIAVWLNASKRGAEPSAPAAASSTTVTSPPAAPPSASVGPPDAEAAARPASDLKSKLIAAADQADHGETARAWLALVEAEPKALDDADVQKQTVNLVGKADPSDEAMTKILYHLTYRAGSIGLDLLYRVLEEAPDSTAAKHIPILFRQSGSERASPALRVTLDIRRMNCSRKLQHFERAGTEGDERTARELDKLRPPSCTLRKGECCLKDNRELEKAVAQIEQRKGKPAASP